MAAVNVINAKKPFIVTSRSEVNWSRMNPEPALKVGVVRTGWKLRFEVRPAAAIPVVPNGMEGLVWLFGEADVRDGY
jgi:hypothetical protein